MIKSASFAASLPTLLAALIGAGLAWLWLNDNFWVAAQILAYLLVVGYALYWIGVWMAPQNPQRALQFLEARALVSTGLAAAASALVIRAAVWLTPGDNASPEAKALLGAVSGAIATALAALFIDSAKEAGAKWLGDPIREAFQKAFASQQLDPEQPAAVALYDDEGGWGYAERRRRAAEIASDLHLPKQS